MNAGVGLSSFPEEEKKEIEVNAPLTRGLHRTVKGDFEGYRCWQTEAFR